MQLTNVFTDTTSHRIILHGQTARYIAVSAVMDTASPQGLLSSAHSAITTALKSSIDGKQLELDNARTTHNRMLEQKETLGTKWRGSIELALLKEKSIKLKKAIARDAEKAKTELRQKKQDEQNAPTIEMVD